MNDADCLELVIIFAVVSAALQSNQQPSEPTKPTILARDRQALFKEMIANLIKEIDRLKESLLDNNTPLR